MFNCKNGRRVFIMDNLLLYYLFGESSWKQNDWECKEEEYFMDALYPYKPENERS